MQSDSPTVKKIMMQFGLTLESVSARANCSMAKTYKALDLRHFSRCPLVTIARVRSGVEKELSRLGWKGQGEELWSDFDAALAKLVASSL
ncbi:MAG: hypothetical protein ACRESK_08340 [Gammaproteobacteria bacterium]